MANLIWTKEYDGVAEPDSGGNYDWTLTATDYVTCAAGIMTFDDIGSGTGYGFYGQVPNVDFNGGFTLEMRLKVIQTETDSFIVIQVRDDTQDEDIYIRVYDDKIILYGSGTTYEMDTTNKFHIYRFVVNGSSVKLYIDTILRIEESVRTAQAGADAVLFGDTQNTTGWNVEFQLDYLNYRLGLARAPNRRTGLGIGNPYIF